MSPNGLCCGSSQYPYSKGKFYPFRDRPDIGFDCYFYPVPADRAPLPFGPFWDQWYHTHDGGCRTGHGLALADEYQYTTERPIDFGLGGDTQPPEVWREGMDYNVWLAGGYPPLNPVRCHQPGPPPPPIPLFPEAQECTEGWTILEGQEVLGEVTQPHGDWFHLSLTPGETYRLSWETDEPGSISGIAFGFDCLASGLVTFYGPAASGFVDVFCRDGPFNFVVQAAVGPDPIPYRVLVEHA